MCVGAAGIIAGILLQNRPEVIWIYVVIGICSFIGLLMMMEADRLRKILFLAIFVACIVTGYGRSYYLQGRYQVFLTHLTEKPTVQVDGVIYKKVKKEDTYVLYLNRVSTNQNQPGKYCDKIMLYSDDDIPMGAEVICVCSIKTFDHATNEGAFDLADYYESLGIAARADLTGTAQICRYACFPLKEILFCLQQRITEIYQAELNDRDSGILSTLVLGNGALLDSEVKNMYQDAGISHILAISGLHISILGLGMFRFLRKIKFGYLFSAAFSTAMVMCFVLMSGVGVSAVRAFLMFAAIMGANVLGKTYDIFNALSIAALVLLIWNPGYLCQSGFLFSFTAILGIAVSSGISRNREQRKNISEGVIREKMRQYVWKPLFSGVLLQLWLIPLTAWYYYEVPIYSVFLNIMVIPLSSYLLLFGLAGGITGFVSASLSKWFLIVCHLILNLYEGMAKITRYFPFHLLITGQPSRILLCIYYMFLIFSSYLLIRMEHTETDRKQFIHFSYPLTGFLISLSLLLFGMPGGNHFCVDVLDVGQGDGICISDADGYHIMIDGGSTSESQVGKYVIEPFLKSHRIRSIDLWIISHTDEDHISGLLELMADGYEIDKICFAKVVPQDSAYEQIISAAKAAGTEVIYATAGDCIRFKTVTMNCLYPGDHEAIDDANGLSMVWLLEQNGNKMLFPGDLPSEEEEILIQRKKLEDIDVLKVGHHGSKYSSAEEFLDILQPELSVISCGENNTYGHPHAECLERLEKCGSAVLITMDCGQIKIEERDDAWTVSKPCERKD